MMDLKGKKVLVVGLGKSGLAAALFLRRKGAQVTVSDVRSAEALAKDIPALLDEGIMVEAGGHGLLTFRRQDLIVVSPGVPLDTPELVQVRNFGLPVIGELELAAPLPRGQACWPSPAPTEKPPPPPCSAKFSSHAGISHARRWQHWRARHRAHRQKHSPTPGPSSKSPASSLKAPSNSIPDIAVILNITPDHLDRHGASKTMCSPRNASFLAQDAQTTSQSSTPTTPRRRCRHAHHCAGVTVSQSSIPSSRERGLRMETLSTAQPRMRAIEPSCRSPEFPSRARTMLRTCSPPWLPRVWPAFLLKQFAPPFRNSSAVEHRLEYVATVNDVEFYNDSKATNVDATAKAIAAFSFRRSSHPRRQRQGLGLHRFSTSCSGARPRRLHHRFCRRQNRVAAARRRFHPLLPDAREGSQRRHRRRPSRRRRSARARLFQLRPV